MYITRNFWYLFSLLLLTIAISPQIRDLADSWTNSEVKNVHSAFVAAAPVIPKIRESTIPFPTISAEGVLVENIKGTEIYYERAPEATFSIASLTKLLTSVLFVERIPQNEEYVISAEAKKTEPNISKVPAGSLVAAPDIVKLMMVESANDAARVAAEKIGKLVNFNRSTEISFQNSLDAAISAMNMRAFEIGMANTNIANPVGFDDALHYSTAKDLFVLMKYIRERHPSIWNYSRDAETAISFRKTPGGTVEHVTIKNTNPLTGKHERIVGSKTGLTDEAGQAVVMLYRLETGETVAIILLKSKDRFGDAEKIIQWLDTQN